MCPQRHGAKNGTILCARRIFEDTSEKLQSRMFIVVVLVSVWHSNLLAQAPLTQNTSSCAPASLLRVAAPAKINSNKPFVQIRANGSKPCHFLLNAGSAYASIDKNLVSALGFHRRAEEHLFRQLWDEEVMEDSSSAAGLRGTGWRETAERRNYCNRSLLSFPGRLSKSCLIFAGYGVSARFLAHMSRTNLGFAP